MTDTWVECDDNDPDAKFIWEVFVDEIYDWNENLMALTLLEISIGSLEEAICITNDSFSLIHYTLKLDR